MDTFLQELTTEVREIEGQRDPRGLEIFEIGVLKEGRWAPTIVMIAKDTEEKGVYAVSVCHRQVYASGLCLSFGLMEYDEALRRYLENVPDGLRCLTDERYSLGFGPLEKEMILRTMYSALYLDPEDRLRQLYLELYPEYGLEELERVLRLDFRKNRYN